MSISQRLNMLQTAFSYPSRDTNSKSTFPSEDAIHCGRTARTSIEERMYMLKSESQNASTFGRGRAPSLSVFSINNHFHSAEELHQRKKEIQADVEIIIKSGMMKKRVLATSIVWANRFITLTEGRLPLLWLLLCLHTHLMQNTISQPDQIVYRIFFMSDC
jgi:hypothetical protein